MSIGQAASSNAKATSDLVSGLQIVGQPQQAIADAVASNLAQILQNPGSSSTASKVVSQVVGDIAKNLQTGRNEIDPIQAAVQSAVSAGSSVGIAQLGQALQTLGSVSGFIPVMQGSLSNPLGTLASQVVGNAISGQSQASQISGIINTVNSGVSQLLDVINSTVSSAPASAPFTSANGSQVAGSFLPSQSAARTTPMRDAQNLMMQINRAVQESLPQQPSASGSTSLPDFAQQFINRAFPFIGQVPPSTGAC